MIRRSFLILMLVGLFVLIFPSISSRKTPVNGFRYKVGKNLVNLLSNFKPSTENPLREIELFAVKLFRKLGLYKLFNGTPSTTYVKLPYQVQLKWPTYEQAKFTYLYYLTSLCESGLDDWSCYYCKLVGNNVKFLDAQYSYFYGTKSHAIVNHERKDIVLIYQTTLSLGSILNDLKAVPVTVENYETGIKIHKGFLEATRAHFDRDLKIVTKALKENPGYKLIVTGQSLGSCMSLIFVFMVKYSNLLPEHTEIEYYGYGLPRIGNKAFVDFINRLNITAVRIYNGDDFVRNIFPAALGYYHIQNEMREFDDGRGGNVSTKLCRRDVYEDSDCETPLTAAIGFPVFWKTIFDHGGSLFNMDPSKCYTERPLDFLLKIILPLNNLIPPKIYNRLPNFTLTNDIYRELREFLYYGVNDLYKIAIDPETYNDPQYKINLNKIVP